MWTTAKQVTRLGCSEKRTTFLIITYNSYSLIRYDTAYWVTAGEAASQVLTQVLPIGAFVNRRFFPAREA